MSSHGKKPHKQQPQKHEADVGKKKTSEDDKKQKRTDVGSGGKVKGPPVPAPTQKPVSEATVQKTITIDKSDAAFHDKLAKTDEKSETQINEPEIKRHRKREIVSNWSKYEINEKEDEVTAVSFNELLDVSKNQSKYLSDRKLASTKSDDSGFKFELSDTSDNLFSINVYKLNEALKCVPFDKHFLQEIGEYCLTDELRKLFEFDAQQARQDFSKRYKSTTTTKTEETHLIEGKLTDFDEIEQLQKLKIDDKQTSNKPPSQHQAQTKINRLQNDVDLQELETLLSSSTSDNTNKQKSTTTNDSSTSQKIPSGEPSVPTTASIDDWLNEVIID